MQRYKIIRGNSLDDLETRVNAFLGTTFNRHWRIEGDIQMYSYSEFAQVITETHTT